MHVILIAIIYQITPYLVLEIVQYFDIRQQQQIFNKQIKKIKPKLLS